jgi:hypothetical protein
MKEKGMQAAGIWTIKGKKKNIPSNHPISPKKITIANTSNTTSKINKPSYASLALRPFLILITPTHTSAIRMSFTQHSSINLPILAQHLLARGVP